jgi:outer membrane protein TolC
MRMLLFLMLLWATPVFAQAVPQLAADATPTGESPRVLRCTYEQCVARALARSPLIAAANKGLELYEAMQDEARSTQYPKVDMSAFGSAIPSVKQWTDVNGVHDYVATNPGDYDIFGHWRPLVLSQLTVTQPLFTFGKIASLKRLAAQGVEIGEATNKIAADEMRYQIARAWWGLVATAQMDDMIKDGKKRFLEERDRQEHMRDVADEKFNQNDLMKINIYYADFEDKVRTAERGRQQAMDGLRMAMAEATDVDVQPDFTAFKPLQFTTLPLAAYEALALANSPKLLAFRHGVAARVEQVQLARNNTLPDVGLILRVAGTYAGSQTGTVTGSLGAIPGNGIDFGGGLGLRWSLDIGRLLAQLSQAKVQADQASLAEKGEIEKTRMDVRQLYREMTDWRAMVDVHEKAKTSAQGWLNATMQSYDDGFESDYNEVLRAIEAYYRRRITWTDAIYNYNVAVAALSRAVGMDVTQVAAKPVVSSATQ